MERIRLISTATLALLGLLLISYSSVSFAEGSLSEAQTFEEKVLEEEAEAARKANEKLPLDQLRNFSDIFARIKSDYVEDVSDKELLENAIRGMLSGLDPHSNYLDPEEYKELKNWNNRTVWWFRNTGRDRRRVCESDITH